MESIRIVHVSSRSKTSRSLPGEPRKTTAEDVLNENDDDGDRG